jgi:acetate---CoA ligase (ADP-forming)
VVLDVVGMRLTGAAVQEPDLKLEVSAAGALVEPRSIAIVGASERSRWSTAIVGNLERHGFAGDLHLVNPRGGNIGGRRAAQSCTAVGAEIDLGIVLVPANAVVEVVADLATAGARAAMILTSGFAEVGPEGQGLQQQLTVGATAAGIRLLGPNSLGFMNFVARTVAWATPISAPSRQDGVALVSQSGATALFLSQLAYQQDIPLSYVVSTGNEADLGCGTFAARLAEDPRVRAMAMFLESVRDPSRFVAAAQTAAAYDKPLVVLKVGASEVSARSALAHTGALVGDDRVFDGICERYDVIRVRSLEELMTTADIAGRTGVLAAGGLCVVSNSGGVCEVAADTADALGIDLPGIPGPTEAELRGLMPDYATPHNPLDLTGGIVPEDCERIVAVLGARPEYAALLVPFYPVPLEPDPGDQRLASLHRHLSVALQATPAPGFLVSYTGSVISPAGRALIESIGLPYLACGMDRALAGLSSAFWWSQRRRRGVADVPREVVPGSLRARPRSEREVLDLFAEHGLPTVPHTLVTTASEAVAVAAGYGGLVVLKIASPDIGHKTEIGGVALRVSGADAVAAAFHRVVAAGRAQPGATVDGVMVSPMREGGVELFAGCSHDPVWGPVLALGLGGIWVEVLSDIAIRPLPVGPDDVLDMLHGLRGTSLLGGQRGLPPADLDAIAATVVGIGDVALGLGPDLAALDVNPLWVRGDTVEILDGLAIWDTEPT